MRDIIRRLPKLRGYSFKGIGSKLVGISISTINSNFNEGETVSPMSILKKGIAKRTGNSLPKIKIISNGKLEKKLLFESCAVSKGAEKKILAAGGSIN